MHQFNSVCGRRRCGLRFTGGRPASHRRLAGFCFCFCSREKRGVWPKLAARDWYHTHEDDRRHLPISEPSLVYTPTMASSVVLRQSLATTKRPLVSFHLQQLGASLFFLLPLFGVEQPHPQHAARLPTLPTFPAVVRPSLPPPFLPHTKFD